MVYLTFDDGPNKNNTAKILDILKKENIHATFFLQGKNVQQNPDLVKRIYNEGNAMNSQSLDDHTKYFIAGSFRDGTRVADINAPLWTQLFFSNKDNLIQEINRFRDSLAEFTELISRGDTEQMTAYLQKAAERRKELMNGSHTC